MTAFIMFVIGMLVGIGGTLWTMSVDGDVEAIKTKAVKHDSERRRRPF